MKHLKYLILAVFLTMTAIPAVAQQDDALPDCDKDTGTAYDYYSRGWVHYRELDYDTALLEFSCAVMIDYEYSDARHMRGLIHEIQGDFESARAEYQQVIDLNPGYAYSYIGLANAYIGLEDYEAAVSILTEYLAFEPDDPGAYFNRAFSNFYLDNFDATLEDYTRVLELRPDDSAAYHNRGLTHFELENYEAAVEDYIQAVAIDPEYAPAYAGRARAYTALGNYEAALADLEIAIAINDYDYGWFYAAQGDVFTALERYDEAREAYDYYLLIVPEEDYGDEVLASIAALEALVSGTESACTISAAVNVNRRAGPGTDFAVLGVLAGGDSAPVDGQTVAEDAFRWWRLADGAGWVRADVVTASGDCDTIPERSR